MCECVQLEMARSESFATSSDDRKLKEAHLMNLNEDLLLSGVVFHFLSKTETTVGRKDAKTPPDVCLNGLRSVSCHSILCFESVYKLYTLDRGNGQIRKSYINTVRIF